MATDGQKMAVDAPLVPAPTPLVIGYWAMRGLGAPARMMAFYADPPEGVEIRTCDQKPLDGPPHWDNSAWFKEVKPELKKINPLVNLPYCIDNGVVISQSNAVFAHIGRKYGLWGRSNTEIARCEELLNELMDVRNKVIGFAYGGSHKADAADHAKQLVVDVWGPNSGPKGCHMEKIEAYMAIQRKQGCSGTFLVGDIPTAPDFHLFEMIDQCMRLEKYYGTKLPYDLYPNLLGKDGFYKRFTALPRNQTYLNSELHKGMPMNNKVAGFGSDPNNGKFVKGTKYTYGNLDGLYVHGKRFNAVQNV